MCMRAYVCVYVCAYVCACVRVCACVFLCVRTRLHQTVKKRKTDRQTEFIKSTASLLLCLAARNFLVNNVKHSSTLHTDVEGYPRIPLVGAVAVPALFSSCLPRSDRRKPRNIVETYTVPVQPLTRRIAPRSLMRLRRHLILNRAFPTPFISGSIRSTDSSIRRLPVSHSASPG